MPARKEILSKVKRLPRYPYHTWSKDGLTGDGKSQELIGLDDVLALLNELLEDSQP